MQDFDDHARRVRPAGMAEIGAGSDATAVQRMNATVQVAGNHAGIGLEIVPDRPLHGLLRRQPACEVFKHLQIDGASIVPGSIRQPVPGHQADTCPARDELAERRRAVRAAGHDRSHVCSGDRSRRSHPGSLAIGKQGRGPAALRLGTHQPAVGIDCGKGREAADRAARDLLGRSQSLEDGKAGIRSDRKNPDRHGVSSAQVARCPVAGADLPQRSARPSCSGLRRVGNAYGNGSPADGSMGLGISPVRRTRFLRFAFGSGTGTADSSASV